MVTRSWKHYFMCVSVCAHVCGCERENECLTPQCQAKITCTVCVPAWFLQLIKGVCLFFLGPTWQRCGTWWPLPLSDTVIKESGLSTLSGPFHPFLPSSLVLSMLSSFQTTIFLSSSTALFFSIPSLTFFLFLYSLLHVPSELMLESHV